MAKKITFDLREHYQKMSYRNRYYLAGPKGKLLMSLPLEHGRNQRLPVGGVKLSNQTNWQNNHWKTIVSLYGRSPFFEYFKHQLFPLFEKKYEKLHDWNIAGINQISAMLKLELNFCVTEIYHKTYPESLIDLRDNLLPQHAPLASHVPRYYQVFEDRIGFLSDCSVLDLLFCEGMHARGILTQSL